jgi:hypothetical protein
MFFCDFLKMVFRGEGKRKIHNSPRSVVAVDLRR